MICFVLDRAFKAAAKPSKKFHIVTVTLTVF